MADMITASLFGESLALALGVAVVVLAYELTRMFRYQRSHAAWMAITLAMAIIVVRRAMGVASGIGNYSLASALLLDYDWAFFSATGAILLFAFWKIKSGFAEERRVEEETMMRIRKFEATRRNREMREAGRQSRQQKK